MDNLAKMKERHARELEEAQEEARIAALLPLAPNSVINLKAQHGVWACYKVKAGDFADFVAPFKPHIQVFSSWRGRYSSFGPTPPKGDESATPSAANYVAAIRVCEGEGYGPSASLILFCNVAGQPVEVHADVCGLGYINQAPVFGARFSSRGPARRGAPETWERYPNPLLEAVSQGLRGPMWRESEEKRQADYAYFFTSLEEAAAIIDAQVYKT